MNKETSALYLEETSVRLVAAQVIVITGLSLWKGWAILAFALSLDFVLRALAKPSLLAVFSKIIFQQLNLLPVQIFAPPKRFAAGIGAFFSFFIGLFLIPNWYTLAYLTGGVLLFFALLESVFKICAGCYVYDWFVAPYINKK
ncbi:MAG: DUF4395 domain-containing protein [Bacteroidia bacterium]|nr:DUF4395 domain-containing protein [Bacteroidia bacterium]